VVSKEKKMENVRNEDKIEDLAYGRRAVVIDGDENSYSIRLPNLKELNEAKLEKTRYYNKLLRSKDSEGNNSYLTREELGELHKSRGVDTDKFREEVRKISQELNKELLDLAKIMNKEDLNEEVNILKDKIVDYRKKINTLLSQEAKLYVNSIESLVEERFNYFLMTQVIDIGKDGEWIKLFKSVDELEKDKRTERFITEFVDYYYGYTSEAAAENPFV
jgi:hypothetical protein